MYAFVGVAFCMYVYMDVCMHESAFCSCSDDPVKCDQYWFGKNPRRMFACRVLLGEVKVSVQGYNNSNLGRDFVVRLMIG